MYEIQMNQIYQKTPYLTVRLRLSNKNESNVSEKNEWKSFWLSLCICAMYSTGRVNIFLLLLSMALNLPKVM